MNAQIVAGFAPSAAAVVAQMQVPATKATLRDVLGSSRRLRFLDRRGSCDVDEEICFGSKSNLNTKYNSPRAVQSIWKLRMRGGGSVLVLIQLLRRGRSYQLKLVLISEFRDYNARETEADAVELCRHVSRLCYSSFHS